LKLLPKYHANDILHTLLVAVYDKNTTADRQAKFLNPSFYDSSAVHCVKFHDDIHDERKYENGRFISRCANLEVNNTSSTDGPDIHIHKTISN
jgi:hypothetical protein